MFWAFEKGIFQFFSNFWATKLKPFPGKVRQSVQTYLNQNLVIGSFLESGFGTTFSSKTNVLTVWKCHSIVFWKFLGDQVETVFRESEAKYSNLFKLKLVIRTFVENGFGVALSSKRIFWAFEKGILQLFENFRVTKLKPFSGKVRQSFQNYLSQNLVILTFLENGFGATLSSKRRILSIWKGHFTIFWEILSDKLETVFRENEPKSSSLFKWKFRQKRTFLENGFGGFLSLKTNVVNVWKLHFSVFCKFSYDEVETVLWEREANRSKLFKSKFGHKNLFRKWFWSNLELKNECCECLNRAFFRGLFFQIFEWRSWNHFLGNWGKAFKAI